MKGKTNALHEIRRIRTTSLEVEDQSGVFLPSDQDADYYDRVTVNINNSFLKAFCQGTVEHHLTKDLLEGNTAIKQYAFQNDSMLKSVVLADTIQTIDTYAFYNTGMRYFETGTGLITLGERAAQNCFSLSEVKIRGNNATIRSYCFYGDSFITKLTLEGVADISVYAFAWCSRLAHVVLPESCTRVQNYCFAVSSPTTSSLNHDFYIVCRRVPILDGNDLLKTPTQIAANAFDKRPLDHYIAFVPWNWFLVYKNYSQSSTAEFWQYTGVWIDAIAGETLPTTSQQYYSGVTKNYTYAWYKEPSMTTPVTVADEDGTYYGIITEVTE